jgi:hypothetical protein
LKADGNRRRRWACVLNAATSNRYKTRRHANNPAATIYLSLSHKKEPANSVIRIMCLASRCIPQLGLGIL